MPESVEEEFLIHEDFVAAVGAYHPGQSPRPKERRLRVKLRQEAVDDAVQRARRAVDDTGAHRVAGRGGDQLLGGGDIDRGEERGLRGERVHGDPDAGEDHTSDIIPVLVDDGDRRCGAHVDDDGRKRIFRLRGHRARDQIRRDGAGIIDPDAEPCADAGADHEGIPADCHPERFAVGLRELGDDGGDDGAAKAVRVDLEKRKDLPDIRGILEACFLPVCLHAEDLRKLSLRIGAAEYGVSVSAVQ